MTMINFVMVLFFQGIFAYRSGPPTSVCEDMMPRHGLQQQPDESPFDVKVDKDYYTPGQQVIVTIRSSGVESFIGMIMQAREKGKRDPIGTFLDLPFNIQHIHCSNEKDTVGHNEKLDSTQITIKWMPPADTSGIEDIVFVATVLKDFFTYWLQISSPELHKKTQYDVPFQTNQSFVMASPMPTVKTPKGISSLPMKSIAMECISLNSASSSMETPAPVTITTSQSKINNKITSGLEEKSLVTNTTKTMQMEILLSSIGNQTTCFANKCKNSACLFYPSQHLFFFTCLILLFCQIL